jgi:hypothetical protein
MIKSLLILVFTLFITQLSAQDKTEWSIDGQLQLRSEVDGRDFSDLTYLLSFTTLRTRVGLKAGISDKLFFYAQAQDSRIFGEERNVTSNIKNLDLHQGFIKIVEPFRLPLTMQAGRFEMAYGTERFFGTDSWTYIGRSFDGVIFSFGSDSKLDLFALSTSLGISYVTNPSPASYNYPEKKDTSSSIYGFWWNNKLGTRNVLDIFTYYDINRRQSNGKYPDNKTATLGFNHKGDYGTFSTITEAAYQLGRRGGIYSLAYFISIQAALEFEAIKAGLGADILSGTNPKKQNRNTTFYNSYGSIHNFNGYMDYFFKSPSSAYLLGLNDYYISVKLAPKKYAFMIGANFHHFSSNASSLYNGSMLGDEIDLTFSFNLLSKTTLTWGGSVFMPGKLMKAFSGGARQDNGLWSYIMVTSNF